MTSQQALLKAVTKLQKNDATSAHLDAEVLLSSVTKKSKEFLLAHPQHSITTPQLKKFNHLISLRLRGTPLAYLTGHKEFYGLDFSITKQVLVPRPETELLVEESIKAVRHLKQSRGIAPVTIADIGTGSGCIAVTLARYLPEEKIFAADISKPALALARKNARAHKIASHITFVQGNLLKPLIKSFQQHPLDLLVANLPYLTDAELPNVRHEPKVALDGGKLGVELIDELLAQADSVMAPDGVILLEIGPKQVVAVEYLVQQQLTNRHTTSIQDLAGHDRVIKVQ